MDARAAAASVALSLVIAAATLTGCGADHDYSCSGDGLEDLQTLTSTLTGSFPEAGTPTAVDDCDSSGKASVSVAHPGSVGSLGDSLPLDWRCRPGKAPTDLDRYFRCTIDGQPTQVIIEYRDDETVTIYLTPTAPAD